MILLNCFLTEVVKGLDVLHEILFVIEWPFDSLDYGEQKIFIIQIVVFWHSWPAMNQLIIHMPKLFISEIYLIVIMGTKIVVDKIIASLIIFNSTKSSYFFFFFVPFVLHQWEKDYRIRNNINNLSLYQVKVLLIEIDVIAVISIWSNRIKNFLPFILNRIRLKYIDAIKEKLSYPSLIKHV